MKRLLLCRPDRVGDVIIASSAFAPIRRQFPNIELWFMAREVMQPLFEKHPALSGFIPISQSPSTHSLVELLLPHQFDAVVHLHPEAILYRSTRQSKIPQRIGWTDFPWGWTLTQALPYQKHEGAQHEAEYNFDLLKLLHLQTEDPIRYSIHLPDDAEAKAAALFPWPLKSTPLIALNPTAHSLVARWPVEHWIRLAEILRQSSDAPFVLIADSEQDPFVQELARVPIFQKNTVNLAGKTDLATLGAILRHASVLVTRNTGSSHLASAVECPVVEFFGRLAPLYGPTRWRTLGNSCISLHSSATRQHGESKENFWKRSYASISPEETSDAVTSLLKCPRLSV